MHLYLGLAAWAATAFVLFKIASWALAKRQFAAKATELGAQEAPSYPNQGLFGLKHLQYIMKADKERLFPDMLLERQAEMSRIHGREVSTFYNTLFGQKVYFTSDPRNIQAMLATQFLDFSLGDARHGIMSKSLGEGIFVQDGKAWEHSRAMLRPNFVIPVDENGWTADTDIQTLFFRFTIDSATDFLFGESVDSQLTEAGLASSKSTAQRSREAAFSKSFDAAQRQMASQFRLGDLWWLSNPKSYQEDIKVINDFIAHYVDLGLQKSKSEKHGSGVKEHYVLLNALAEQTQDPIEIRGQLLNILLAGRDTTASLLSWTFHQLLRNPHVFKKLRSEIVADFGTYENPRNLSFATLKSCTYLQQTLSEVLRLWTVVPGNGRRAAKVTTLPRGGGPDGESPILLAPNTEINYSIHVMHRRESIWGPDATEFKPERFAGRKSGWEYLPFNGGPRVCIGQQFALTEAAFVVVRLLQRFDQLEFGGGERDPVIRSNLTLTSAPAELVRVRMREARD
nr:hypothetical protein B0A51_14576 [Rachicladosporium sp. CCFEE 5018]